MKCLNCGCELKFYTIRDNESFTEKDLDRCKDSGDYGDIYHGVRERLGTVECCDNPKISPIDYAKLTESWEEEDIDGVRVIETSKDLEGK